MVPGSNRGESFASDSWIQWRRDGDAVDRRHREQPLLTFDPLQPVDPVIGEAEPGPCDELARACGDEGLSGSGDRHDPCARVDGDPTELAFDPLRFAEMDTRPDLHAERPDTLRQRACTTDRGGRRWKRGEDTIARGIDELAVEAPQRATHLVVVAGEERAPSGITDLRCDPGRINDIGERDRSAPRRFSS